MKVKPFGIVKTICGNQYFLLRPQPLPSDSWMQKMDTDMWYVAEMIVHWDANDDVTYVAPGRSFHLMTAHPDIEFRWDMEEIEIGDIQDEAEEQVSEKPEPPENFLSDPTDNGFRQAMERWD